MKFDTDLGQNILRERLGHLVEVGFNAGLLETFLLSFGKLLNVAVQGVYAEYGQSVTVAIVQLFNQQLKWWGDSQQ